MSNHIQVRLATIADAPTLAEFNAALALETEHKTLEPSVVSAGVRQFMHRPALGFYLVAEISGHIAGALMITYEWSDWRNGIFWWIQSVYVRPAFRRQGVFRALYRQVETMAAAQGDVCGLRLYVERDNAPAQSTYYSLGLEATPYLMLEKPLPHAAGLAQPAAR